MPMSQGRSAAHEAVARSADRVLAVDVGNTTTRLGIFAQDGAAEDEPLDTFELTTPERLTADEARLLVTQFASFSPAPVAAAAANAPEASCKIAGCILSCVVPALVEPWRRALDAVCERRALVVGPGLKTGIRMDYHDPSEVGPDRIADAVAARALLGAPAIAVDMGTTVNIEVIDAAGHFAGGVIAPGLALGANALASSAARLPHIELAAPSHVIGKSTREAMLSGVVLGEAIRVDGLVARIERELGAPAPVVLTGDDAASFSHLLAHECVVDHTLTLRGLHLLYLANARPPRQSKARAPRGGHEGQS